MMTVASFFFFRWFSALYIRIYILVVLVGLPYGYGFVAIPPQLVLVRRIPSSAIPATRSTPCMYVIDDLFP